MALFSRKNKPTDTNMVVEKSTTNAHATDRDLTSVIKSPRITEKAMMQGDNHVYTFMVARNATKFMVRDAVSAIYKVTPVKVNIVNKAPKTTMSRTRGRAVAVKGYKKAFVYLKSGDTINLV